MRLLRYWSGPRRCRFLALAKTRAQRRYRPSEQPQTLSGPKAVQPYEREAFQYFNSLI
jgi:hypothetical protein